MNATDVESTLYDLSCTSTPESLICPHTFCFMLLDVFFFFLRILIFFFQFVKKRSNNLLEQSGFQVTLNLTDVCM